LFRKYKYLASGSEVEDWRLGEDLFGGTEKQNKMNQCMEFSFSIHSSSKPGRKDAEEAWWEVFRQHTFRTANFEENSDPARMDEESSPKESSTLASCSADKKRRETFM
jgi:hypothetical protein